MFMQLATLLMLYIGEVICSQPPNIIFMLIDDLGWNDVSFHGSLQIPTPNIDTLAYNGVILNNYYVQALCTPSRAALLTGKLPIRLGLQHFVIESSQPYGLDPNETIMPQHFKHLGYSTHGIGKWHLGYFRNEYLPTNRGFDSFLGYWNGLEDHFTHINHENDMPGYDFNDNTDVARNYCGLYGTQVFTDRAKNIIKNHNVSKPLFLYLSHQAVHTGNKDDPLQAPDEYVRKFSHIKDEERKNFAGMVSVLDKSVGDIFTALNDASMLDNSIIIFSTDNGGAVEGSMNGTGSNWPLRGGKITLWEGGIRGAAFVWSPLIKQRHVSENLMHISDWLPTLYAVVGGDVDDLGPIDGYNLWPSIAEDLPSPRNHILLNIDPIDKYEAIRKDQYKLLRGRYPDGDFDGWFDKEGKKIERTPFSDEEIAEQYEVYQRKFAQSQVAPILSKKYGISVSRNSDEICNCNNSDSAIFIPSIVRNYQRPHFLVSPIEVNCGSKPEFVSSNCQTMKEACLYNVKSDPCEYYNLAKEMPKVAQELDYLLDEYRKEAAPPRNQPIDPAANPKYHHNACVPWKEPYIKPFE